MTTRQNSFVDDPQHGGSRRPLPHLAIVDHGKVIAVGTPEELKKSVPGGFLFAYSSGNRLLNWLQRLGDSPELAKCDLMGFRPGTDVYADQGGALIPQIAAVAMEAGAELARCAHFRAEP